MPLNPLLKAPEIAYQLRDSDAAAIVTVDLFADEVLKAVPDVGDIPVFVVRTTDAELPPGTRPFEELYQAADTRDIAPTDADDAAIPGEVLRAFEQAFPGVVVLEGYGLSETSALATFNFSADERKVLSIGKPMWGVDLRIMDDDGHELPRGTEHVGEICLRGHNVMKGYYKNPDATAAAMHGGWFHTGDLAYRDEDGFVFIV